MMRSKLVVSALGVALVPVTLFSSAASAKVKIFPSLREFTTGRILVSGEPLQFKASDLLLATKEGNIACEDGRLTAKLQSNSLKEDSFVVTAAAFHDAKNGPCPSSLPGLGPATITSDPPPGGWAGVVKSTSGQAKVMGQVVLTAKFEPHPGQTLTCVWSATKFKLTWIPNGQPIEARISNAKFKRSGTTVGCPKTAHLSADYNLTAGAGKQVAVSMS